MGMSKKHLLSYLRKLRLRKLVDNIMFFGDVLSNRQSNKSFLAKHPDFVPPPAHLAFDAHNTTNWRDYYNLGLNHSKLISDLIREYQHERELTICEWGCGPARVIRHLHDIEGFEKIALYGTDYNEESIDWCERHIKDVRFIKNDLEPPLPFNADLFDCVYAISIFTHLSEKLHYAWIEELFRIIKPGGILIFTTHGDVSASSLMTEEKEKYDAGFLVVRDQAKEGRKLFSTYHPPQFIRYELLRDYAVLKHLSNASGYQMQQEVWCARKQT